MTATGPPSEANLRDQLISQLDRIEYGLRDPIKNYPLPNPHGTKGFIDILARDRHGRRVVIEVKCTKKATREALHEIGKYMELLSRAEGYTPDRIRALIVSTEWDELRAPFSEAARRSEERLDGYQLTCDEFGQLVEIERVNPLSQLYQHGMAYGHVLFCFETVNTRESGWRTLVERANAVGASDVIGVQLDHNLAESGRLVRPYMLYLVVGDIDPERLDPGQFGSLVESRPSRTDIRIDWDVDNRTASERFRDNLRTWLMRTDFDSRVEAELAGREMFARLLSPQSDWRIIRLLPRGIFRDRVEPYNYNSDFLGEIAGWNVRNPTHFIGSASSSDATSWRNYRLGINDALAGVDFWRRIVMAWLGSVGDELPRADIESHICPSGDLLYALIRGWPWDIDRHLPSLYITVIQNGTTCARVGSLSFWDGTAIPDLIERVRAIYPTPSDWLRHRVSGTAQQVNTELLDAFHLSWNLMEEFDDTHLLTVEEIDGTQYLRLVRNPLPNPDSMLTIWDFFGEHIEQLNALRRYYGTTV